MQSIGRVGCVFKLGEASAYLGEGRKESGPEALKRVLSEVCQVVYDAQVQNHPEIRDRRGGRCDQQCDSVCISQQRRVY